MATDKLYFHRTINDAKSINPVISHVSEIVIILE